MLSGTDNVKLNVRTKKPFYLLPEGIEPFWTFHEYAIVDPRTGEVTGTGRPMLVRVMKVTHERHLYPNGEWLICPREQIMHAKKEDAEEMQKRNEWYNAERKIYEERVEPYL